MPFPVLGSNSAVAGYEIDNSCRFSDSNYLTRDNTTQSGGGTNFTFSAWLKMTSYDSGGFQGILSIFKDSNDFFEIYKDNSENLQIQQQISGTSVYYQSQHFKYRDYSAWYHLVVNFDNSESSEVDKVSVYVNGTELTGTVNNSNPFADVGLGNTAYDTRVGAYRDNTSATWNGYMADVYLIAGQTLAASEFGETNDNGVWIPKAYSGSYGDNGFFLEWQNSGSLGTDTSGNGNNLTVTGLSSTDQTTDTPTNNFCTANPLNVNVSNPVTFAEGNLQVTVPSGNVHMRSDVTMYPSNGKWYGEFTFTAGYSTANGTKNLGIITSNAGRQATNDDGFNKDNGNSSSTVGYRSDGKVYFNGSLQTSGLTTFTINDIIGIAMDLDNDKLFISKNGTFFSNGTGTQDPANGTNPIYSGSGISDYKQHGFGMGMKGYGDPANVMAHNFGNPYTSISSGNSDANGYGNFEYAVPSGYYALCTKNLAEYG